MYSNFFFSSRKCMHMAFMIPVVRNDWDVWMGSGKPRPSGKSSRNGQVSFSRVTRIQLANKLPKEVFLLNAIYGPKLELVIQTSAD